METLVETVCFMSPYYCNDSFSSLSICSCPCIGGSSSSEKKSNSSSENLQHEFVQLISHLLTTPIALIQSSFAMCKPPYHCNANSYSHEMVLKRCGIINTLTIWGREWGGGVFPTFLVARQWWTVNNDYLQSNKIQAFYYQVYAFNLVQSKAWTPHAPLPMPIQGAKRAPTWYPMCQKGPIYNSRSQPHIN